MNDHAVTNSEATDAMVNILERVVKTATDISTEMDRVESMTLKDGYQRKIDLIMQAEDMSTKEKISAIDAVENKYAHDRSENAELYKDMMKHKAWTVLVCTAGIVVMVASPEGQRIAKSIIKAAVA